ncbi:MAG TPA: DUF4870 domain-containing protein [Patescibacteria group bacterium]|nr:DUF4870 domain-containing protein [Patescibacteria group bacterium]
MNNVTTEQKLWSIAAHLSYFLGGIGFVLAPLLIFFLKKEDPFVADHAKQALVAHVSILLAGSVVAMLSALLIGILLWPLFLLLLLGLLITSLIAAWKALDGDVYRYPLIQCVVERL